MRSVAAIIVISAGLLALLWPQSREPESGLRIAGRGGAVAGSPAGATLEPAFQAQVPAARSQDPDAVSVRAADLWSRAPVAGCTFRALMADGRSCGVYRSDAEGRFSVPAGADKIEVTAEGWGIADDRVPNLGPSRELWLFRRVQLTGVVIAAPGYSDDIARCRITLIQVLPPDLGPGASELGGYRWLRARRLDEIDLDEVGSRDGAFSREVPRLPGYHVVASLDGHRRGSAQLSFSPSGEAQSVRLILERAPVLLGRVVDEVGRPIAGAIAHIFASIEGSPSDVDELFRMAQLRGVSAAKASSNGRSEFITTLEGVSDGLGMFEILVPMDGMRWDVEVYAPGHVPSSSRDAWNGGGELTVVVSATPAERSRVQFTRAGSPLADIEVTAGLADRRHSLALELGVTDRGGWLPADWLGLGRVYFFAGSREGREEFRGYAKWNGESQIAVESLHPRPQMIK